MSVPVPMPKLGLTMTEGRIVRWLVADGSPVKAGTPIFEVETDKATVETQAPADGVLHILVQENTMVAPGGVVARIQPPGEETLPASEVSRVSPRDAAASPAAKRRAREFGIDIHLVMGTGEEGRITERDVEEHVAQQPMAPAVAARQATVSPVARRMAEEAGIEFSAVIGTGADGRITKEDVERAIATGSPAPDAQRSAPGSRSVPIKGVRALIAQRMQESAQKTARVTLVTELDATELVSMRAALRPGFEAQGIPVSYDALLVVIVAKSLGEFPHLNAMQVGSEMRILEEVNIGVAIDTERGLLVPVLRDANNKTILDVAREVNELTGRALAGRSSPDELHGGTFTITNLGMFDVDAFTPIINPPELAILGVGRIVRKPAEHEGQIALRDRLTLSLSFDHRLVDGAPAARFLQRVKQLCERPYLVITT